MYEQKPLFLHKFANLQHIDLKMVDIFMKKFLRALPAALAAAAIALAAVSCEKSLEIPEPGRYYSVKADGTQYFVWLESADENGNATGHFYIADGQSPAPRHDFTARFSRKRLSISADGNEVRLKNSSISYEPYIEPPFEERDTRLYREKYCDVSVKKDVIYADVQGYWSSLEGAEEDISRVFSQGFVKSFRKRGLKLAFDLYRPEDLSGRRPLIMFIHGGAFYIGHKAEPAYIDFCRHFAAMGYVTASIDYRLGFHLSKNEIERAGYVALQDAHAALRFLVSHADEYNIDPERIFVAGSSAGGITALNLAFMKDDDRPKSSRGKKAFLSNKADLGGIESSGNRLQADFNIIAIANMWGAVSDLDILGNARTSIVSFHGTEDTTVPYAEGYPLSVAGEGIAKMLSEEMFGSACIDKKAEELGLRHHFYSFKGEKHAFNTTGKDKKPNANHTVIKDRITDFFYAEMVPVPASIVKDATGCYHIEGSNVSDVEWKVEGGFVLAPPQGNGIRILWCADKTGSLTASGTYGNEIAWNATLK